MTATMARRAGLVRAGIGIADFGRGENYVARQVERWSKQYRASQTERIDEMEDLIAWLPAHIPPAGPVRLDHGQPRLDHAIPGPPAPARTRRPPAGRASPRLTSPHITTTAVHSHQSPAA